MTLLEEALFYVISAIGSPVLLPIIFNNPKKAAGFVRQFTGPEGEEAFLKKICSKN